MHHCIPRTLNPPNNIIIPLCHKCHEKINFIDISTTLQYLIKVIITLEKDRKGLLCIETLLKNFIEEEKRKKENANSK
jgi:hypothetical protein